MNYRIIIQPTAKTELREAYRWYYNQSPAARIGGSTSCLKPLTPSEAIPNVAPLLPRTTPLMKPSASYSMERSEGSTGSCSRSMKGSLQAILTTHQGEAADGGRRHSRHLAVHGSGTTRPSRSGQRGYSYFGKTPPYEVLLRVGRVLAHYGSIDCLSTPKPLVTPSYWARKQALCREHTGSVHVNQRQALETSRFPILTVGHLTRVRRTGHQGDSPGWTRMAVPLLAKMETAREEPIVFTGFGATVFTRLALASV